MKRQINEELLLEKMRNIVGYLSSQTETLGILIDSKTGVVNHGTQGLTYGTHDVENCLKQIEELLNVRGHMRIELAKLQGTLSHYANARADNIMASIMDDENEPS